MIVKAKETCFIDGHRRREGAVFEFKGTKLPKCVEAVDGTVEDLPKTDKHYDDDEIGKLRVKLAERGIKVPPRTGKARMIEMLAEVEGKTGLSQNEDVI